MLAPEPIHQEVIADFMFPMNASARTLFPSIALIVMTPTTPQSSAMAVTQQSSPSAIAPPPLEVDFKDEFIKELVESF